MWFWYEKNFSGSYMPAMSPNNPDENDFKKKQTRFGLRELKAEDLGLTLTRLSARYPPPGVEFKNRRA